MSERFENAATSSLRDFAMSLPEVTEGASCVNRAFKVRKKNFLFVGEKDNGECKVMFKLGESVARATALAAGDSRFEVGKAGWTTVRFTSDDAPRDTLLREWAEESFRLMAPKSLFA